MRVDPEKMNLVHPQKEGRCNYGAEIEHIDRLMSSIVQQLEATGELANTVVVVAGDHGEVCIIYLSRLSWLSPEIFLIGCEESWRQWLEWKRYRKLDAPTSVALRFVSDRNVW